MKRLGRLLLLVVGLALMARLALQLVPLPLQVAAGSVLLLDREGRPLREAWRGERGASRRVALAEVAPTAIQAIVAAEDARFYGHWGVDGRATLAALYANLRAREVVAGGSTLTQQLVRNLSGRAAGWSGKLGEALVALRLETVLSKDRILELYLNSVPFGNNTHGIESASRFYFGRPAASLSLAQSAYLAAIPRGPDFYDPLIHPERTGARQRWILQRMAALGMVSAEQLELALAEPISVAPHSQEFRAPHFCEAVLGRISGEAVRVQTTLDGDLQLRVETIVRERVAALKDRGLNSAAVVVLDNASGEVRAWVGSADFFDASADGQVDGVTSLRQPGSALKPFIYSLALENGMTPATLLADLPVRYRTGGADFRPTNYDEKFHGPVRLRTALASSYNVPAVKVLHEIGPRAFLDRLHHLGFDSLTQPAEHYGLALGLGAGEVSLLELTNAYRALARQGRWSPPRLVDSDGGAGRQVISPKVAFLLLDILSDPAARAPGFGHDSVLALPFPCAVKTGTSRAYRDNWTVGCSSRFTVGVWAGNTRGTPMRDVSGVTGAGPIFREVMLTLHRSCGSFGRPEGLTRRTVCALSGQLAGPYCEGTLPEWVGDGERCTMHRSTGLVYPPEYRDWGGQVEAPEGLRITFPTPGDSFVIDPALERRFQTLAPRAVGGTGLVWTIDGAPLEGEWQLRPGAHEIGLSSREGGRARVSFTVR